MTPEDQTFLSSLRLRSLPGSTNPPTLEEMKRAIILLRANRSAALTASHKATKPRKPAPSAADIADALSDLDSM